MTPIQRDRGISFEPTKAKIEKIPCIFPCYRELIAESSSIETVSTAIKSFSAPCLPPNQEYCGNGRIMAEAFLSFSGHLWAAFSDLTNKWNFC